MRELFQFGKTVKFITALNIAALKKSCKLQKEVGRYFYFWSNTNCLRLGPGFVSRKIMEMFAKF
jgi:hypothetical protein